MWLWHTGFEAGPNRKTQTTSTTNALVSFAAQDIWEGIGSVNSYNIIDADAGGSPHCGRYSFRPVYLGFGDATTFVGHTHAKTGNTIWWSQRVKIDGFDAPSSLSLSQVYVLSRFSYNDGVKDSGNKYMGFGAIVSDGTIPSLNWSLLHFNADNTYNTTLIAAVTPFTPASGWVWLQAEYNTSTGDIKFFIDDVQEGATLSGTGTWNSVPAIRFACSMVQGKNQDAGMRAMFCCMGANDSNGTIATTRPTTATRVILHQPDGNQTHQWSGEGYIDVADQAASCPRYANTIIASNVGDVSLYTIKDKTAAGTVQSIRIIYEQDFPGIGNPTHTIRARISAGTYQDYTNPSYSRTGGSRFWVGQEFQKTVEATPVDWTNTLFNSLDAGVKAINTDKDVGEFCISVIGPDLARTAYNSCLGSIKTHLGGSFTAKPVMTWNGTAWVQKSIKYWNGSAWVITPY